MNNTEDVELRDKVSDQLANLMVKASLEKLKGDGDILEKGRHYISMHNEELSVIMQLFQQEANKQKLALLERIIKSSDELEWEKCDWLRIPVSAIQKEKEKLV